MGDQVIGDQVVSDRLPITDYWLLTTTVFTITF